jgi:hypothetical protein
METPSTRKRYGGQSDKDLHQKQFLEAFAVSCSIQKAARYANVHRQTHYDWLAKDPSYPARFREAQERAGRTLEDEAVRRAKDGIEKPVLYKGRQVYVDGEPLYEHQHSDTLLMFLLRAYDREKFGDRQVIELKLEDWDGDLSKLSEQSARRLLQQIEEKIAAAEAKENALAQLPAGHVIDGESARVPE